MSHIFISYSRKDLTFAQRIVDALAAQGLDTWIDWEDIPKTVDWKDEIFRGIEKADAFLFLVSPDSIQSEVCNEEVSHAVENGKRILPIVIRPVDPKNTPSAISKLNWIFCRDGQDDFDAAVGQTREAIHTDYEWLKYHTELQVKALVWEKHKDTSRLLRGKELREGEEQLAKAGGKIDPQPTDLQRQYVLLSRRTEERQRRRFTIGLGFGFSIVVLLAVFAWVQRNHAITSEATAVSEANAKATALANEKNARATADAERNRAEEQARIALSRQLAAQAKLNLENNVALSLLLSAEASNTENTFEAQEILLRGLQQNRRLEKILYGHKDSITSLAINTFDEGTILASGSNDGTIILWNFSDPIKPALLKSIPQAHSGAVYSLVFTSQNNRIILVSGSEEQIIFWDISIPTSPIQLTTLPSPPTDGNYLSMVVSSSSNILAVGGGSGISFWDISNPALPIQAGESPSAPFGSIELAFDSDGKTLASQAQQTIEVWDISNLIKPASILTVSNVPGYVITSSKFWLQPNKLMMALGTETGAIQLWELAQNNQLANLGSPELKHSSSVVALAFSPNGKILVSKGYDETLIYWDLSDLNSENWRGEYLQKKTTDTINSVNFLEAEKGAAAYFKATDMIFSADGNYLISGNDDGSIFLWDMTNSTEPLSPLPNPLGNTTSDSGSGYYDSWLDFGSLNNRNIMMTRSRTDKVVKLWDVSDITNPRLVNESLYATRPISGYNSDTNLLILGSDDGIIFWDVTDPLALSKVSSLSLPFSNNSFLMEHVSAVISPNGKTLVIANSLDNQVDLWDISNPVESIRVSSFTTPITGFAFSLDSKILAISGGEEGIILWNIADLKNPTPFGIPFWTKENPSNGMGGFVDQISFNSTSDMLVASDSNGILANIAIWDITNPQKPTLLSNQIADQLPNFALSPNGKRLVTINGFGQILIWDVSSPADPVILGNLAGFAGPDTSQLKFSPNGNILAIWDANGLILWDMDVDSWKNHACAIAGRNLTRAEWTQFIGDALPYQAVCPNLPIEPEVIITPTP